MMADLENQSSKQTLIKNTSKGICQASPLLTINQKSIKYPKNFLTVQNVPRLD